MEDTDWRAPPIRESKHEHVKLFVLRTYDGGEGFQNQPSGYVTKNKAVAEEWSKRNHGGNSYDVIDGILVNTLDELESAGIEREKQKALNKLTERERELLGLEDTSIDQKLAERIRRPASSIKPPLATPPSTSYGKPGQIKP